MYVIMGIWTCESKFGQWNDDDDNKNNYKSGGIERQWRQQFSNIKMVFALSVSLLLSVRIRLDGFFAALLWCHKNKI